MATLKTTCTISMSSQGITVDGKHGAASDASTTAVEMTVTGTVHERIGTVGDSAGAVMFASSGASGDDLPSAFDYLFFWSDQNVHIQLMDVANSNWAEIGVTAKHPFIMSDGDILVHDSDTSAISDASATLNAIDKIVVGNSSGATANYHLILVD